MPAGRAAPGVANSSSCSRLQHQFNKYVKCGGGEGGGDGDGTVRGGRSQGQVNI